MSITTPTDQANTTLEPASITSGPSNSLVQEKKSIQRVIGSLPVSILIAVLLYGALIYFAGPWNILANTRFLNWLIDAGVIQYTDVQAGFIEGVGSHAYYLASQDPIDWAVLAVVVGLFLIFFMVKGTQLHWISRYHGLPGSAGEHIRAYLFGLGYSRVLPFNLGDAATSAWLHARGGSLDRISSAIFLFNVFVVFEITVFALYGLFALGWSVWLTQIFWALVILGVFYAWTRADAVADGRLSIWGAVKAHVSELVRRPWQLGRISLLSLIAFGLQDVAAYLVAMGFTSDHVVLNVDFSLLLMGVVGSYVARLVRLTPGGIGQFEWGFAAALYIGGLGFPEAATIAILNNIFRYATYFVLWLITAFWPSVKIRFGQIAKGAAYPESLPDQLGAVQTEAVQTVGAALETGQLDTESDTDMLVDIPRVPLVRLPTSSALWVRLTFLSWIIPIYLFGNQLAVLLADYWLLQSLGLTNVFWTNFQMGATLFVTAFLFVAVGVAVAAWVHPVSRRARPYIVMFGVQTGLLAGSLFASDYQNFLLSTGKAFGYRDPVFGLDTSFYAFTLPTIHSAWLTALLISGLLLLVSIGCAYAAVRTQKNPSTSDVVSWIGAVATPYSLILLSIIGVLSAIGVWLTRFSLLYKDNSYSSIATGADYLDVTGFFSPLNQALERALVVLALIILLVVILRSLHRHWRSGKQMNWALDLRRLTYTAVALIAFDFAFAGIIFAKDVFIVRPNEPVIQLDFIREHIESTRRAYKLTEVEEVEFMPKGGDDPLPEVDDFLASAPIQNIPLWPTYTNYLEPLIDPDYDVRILQTDGDTMIYGPTLEIFRQQQKLRTYYNFLRVSPLRFQIDGKTEVFVSAAREIPLLEPQPWLSWWGQRFLLFTHGYGLVMAPVSQVNAEGEPIFVSRNIPSVTDEPELAVGNPSTYYGEGAATMAFSNIRNLKEFDYPTSDGRAETTLPLESNIGVSIDSLLKRVVFGWLSGQFFEIVFSDLITPDTRLHYLRTPMERLKRVAPFLDFDSNVYAIPAEGEIHWLVNALTTTDMYPYSKRETLGDKSIGRQPDAIDMVQVNYLEDSVKATVNAYTGQVQFYQISDDPIISTWAEIYPNLFIKDEAMPEEVRSQLTYPLHLFHIQFDDIYITYHMQDPVYYFNMEDMWDDADEVIGPILDEGKAISFSIEPYHALLETGGLLPESENGTQFALMAVFTPENALNLRAITLAYQDGEDYGRLIALQVPKGQFVMSPEQADASIDQEPEITQRIAWWNRRGTEVIRGHTITLVVDGELLYVEPLFIRSKQNPVPQLRKVSVVFRNQVKMMDTLEDALRYVMSATHDIDGTDTPLAGE